MNIKKYIINKLEEAGEEVSNSNLNRYINGWRIPSYSLAKQIVSVVGGNLDIWLDRGKSAQRKVVLSRLARNKKGDIFFTRGRPKKTQLCRQSKK